MKLNLTSILLLVIVAFGGWFLWNQSKSKAAAPAQPTKEPTSAGNNILPETPPVPVGQQIVKETIIQYIQDPRVQPKPKPVKPGVRQATNRRVIGNQAQLTD